MKKIIFATGNQGKMDEIRQLLAGFPVQVISMAGAGIQMEIEESGTTFEENAIIKAKAVMELTGELTLADDSGLEVDHLNKEPGVYSSRYMGEDTPYHEKMQSILDRLAGVPDEKRTARFVSVIAAAVPGQEPFCTRGTVEGIIGYEEKGNNGFGYDPIFYVPKFGCTTAELSMDDKNRVSHRGEALRLMKEELIRRKLVTL